MNCSCFGFSSPKHVHGHGQIANQLLQAFQAPSVGLWSLPASSFTWSCMSGRLPAMYSKVPTADRYIGLLKSSSIITFPSSIPAPGVFDFLTGLIIFTRLWMYFSFTGQWRGGGRRCSPEPGTRRWTSLYRSLFSSFFAESTTVPRFDPRPCEKRGHFMYFVVAKKRDNTTPGKGQRVGIVRHRGEKPVPWKPMRIEVQVTHGNKGLFT